MLCIYCTHAHTHTHTQKATSPRLLLRTMPENSSDYAGHSRVRTRAVLSYLFFFFFTSLWTFASTTLKSILYLLGYKSFFVMAVGLFVSVRVGFQMLEHFSIIYLIDFQPRS